MISVLIPSRGLLHSETVEAVDRELMGIEHHPVLYTHDESIPDCFNILSERFLETDSEFAWFVEEDVVPPKGSLDALLGYLDRGFDISFINYPLVKFKSGKCYKYFQGHIIWTGMGCTLIRRKVFEKLSKPWFLDGHSLVALHAGSSTAAWSLELRKNPKITYGGQDVYFCTNAFFNGFTLGVVPHIECKHLVA